MGYSFRPARAFQTAKLDLAMKSIRVDQKVPPVWLKVLEKIPPPEILTRPKPIPHRDPNPKQRKPKNLFKPQRITFPEDELRRNFFKDHPWELARPRIAVEYDGKDSRYVNWATGLRQPGMQVTGESVIQRQLWLMENGLPHYETNEATGETVVAYSEPLTKAQAYDIARKEFYTIRQHEDIERRIAQEEARMVGAYFGKNKLQVGMELEDQTYNTWKEWAQAESAKLVAEKESAYANFGAEESKSTLAEFELETEAEQEPQPTKA